MRTHHLSVMVVLLVAGATTAAIGQTARAAEKVCLRPHFEKGTVVRMTMTSDGEIDQTISGARIPGMPSKAHQTVELSYRVTEVTEDGGATLEATCNRIRQDVDMGVTKKGSFDSENENQRNAEGMDKELVDAARPLVGLRLTIEFDKDLHVTKEVYRSEASPSRKKGLFEAIGTAILLGQFDQAISRETLKEMMVQSLVRYLPRELVAVGESWTPTEKTEALTESDEFITSCTLLGIGKHKGRRCAKIQIDFKMKSTASQPAKRRDGAGDPRVIKCDWEGICWFDIDAGQVIEVILNRDIQAQCRLDIHDADGRRMVEMTLKRDRRALTKARKSGVATLNHRLKTRRHIIAEPQPPVRAQ